MGLEVRRQKKVPLRHSLRMKFVLSYLLIMGAVLALMNTYPILASESLVFQSKQVSLQNQALMIASSLAPLEELTTEGVEPVMELLDHMSLTRVMVTDRSARILYDTAEEDTLGRYALFQEISLALQGQDVVRYGYSDGAFRSRAAVPVVYRNVTIGAVYVYEYDSDGAELLLGTQRSLRNISIVVCAMALAVSLLFSRALMGRISKLLSAIQSLREGEYSHRVELSGRDELSALAGEFNQMTERLQATEEVRRRFVADASHELKTPLASIRLLTDSILQNEGMDSETVRDFVADIGDEADRLNRITEKLLALTRLDNRAQPERRVVDVADVLEDVMKMLYPLAQDSRVTLQAEMEPDCRVLASRDDLYQVLFNLVENAVKYNVENGWVRVSLSQSAADGPRVTILVEDSGIGIPEEDMPKIFDRFYRVDKARSREAGGTGLGLSIVRDVVTQHGGRITVGRREGGGSWFRVSFPQAEEEGQE